MKKTLALMVCLVMLFSLVMPVSAAGADATVTQTPASDVKAGDEVKLTVAVSGASDSKSGKAQVTLSDGLEIVSGKVLVSDTTLASYNKAKNQAAYARTDAGAINGDFLEVVVKVKDDATADQTVTFELEMKPAGETVTKVHTIELAKAPHTHTAGAAVKENEVPATCEVAGSYDEVVYCTECGEEMSRESKTVAALGHDWGEWEVTKPATETEEGEMTRTCKNDASHKETKPIAKLDHVHTLEHVDAVAATCTAAGVKEHYKCSVCGNLFEDAAGTKPLTDATEPALGHDWGEWTETKPATESTKGEKERVCKRCGEKETAVVPFEDLTDIAWSTYYNIEVLAGVGGEVKVNPKTAARWGKVTVTVTPDDGYEFDDITVTDRKGNELKVHDQGNGKHTFTMPDSNVTVDVNFKKVTAPVVDDGNPFNDVTSTDYFYDPVLWAVENGVTAGTSDNTFSPKAPATRAQFVTFLWRAAGKPSASVENPFTDVAAGQYYTDAVLWAVENGITNGTSATTFEPNATLTRGQVVTFLYRFCKGTNTATENPFTDVAEDAWYYDAVLWAVANKVTNGMSDTTFAPAAICDRGQTVTFLSRVFGD